MQIPLAVTLLIVAGLFDNVLSDYLWARAVLLTGDPRPQNPQHLGPCGCCLFLRELSPAYMTMLA